jgi:hypothetical protein
MLAPSTASTGQAAKATAATTNKSVIMTGTPLVPALKLKRYASMRPPIGG